MKENTTVKKNEVTAFSLPEGILCAGYCKQCRYSEPYTGSWWYCNYFKKSVEPFDWKECCE